MSAQEYVADRLIITTSDDDSDRLEYLVHVQRTHDSNVVLDAQTLKLNGFGFATSGCEIAEHGETVNVTKDGQHADIEVTQE